MRLIDFGWNDEVSVGFKPYSELGLRPARVLKQLRDLSLLLSEQGELFGKVAGKFRHQAPHRSDYPVVGDWVATEPPEDDRALIQAVLPRRGVFIRKAAGEPVEAQVVAANVDTVFLVSGLDGDLNLRRIERYLATVWDSGASPVILLNKADLRIDLQKVMREVELVAPGVPVVAVSALAGGNLDALRPYLVPRKTVALLGSSGVGKSTLINRLMGEERFRTAPISDAEQGRGRHTTTTRELVRIPGGALLIDTPGMREIQLWTDDEGLGLPFKDIEELAARCQFADCSHEREPGCAVQAAVSGGILDARRLESYLKLRREIRVTALKKDVKTRRQHEKATGRQFAARLKEVKKYKPRYQ
jgi:ribosome biogenesis GTPase / thiamine phosphate phosphatase